MRFQVENLGSVLGVTQSDKPAVWDHSGRFPGLLTPETEHRIQEGPGIIRVGFPEDGNLRCAITMDNPSAAPSELTGPNRL